VSEGSTIMVDREFTGGRAVVMNETDVDTRVIADALSGPHPELAQMIRWTVTTHGGMGYGRQGSLFQRDRFVTPERLFDQFKVAKDAAESDDVISGVLDSTESLSFNRISFACNDEDEEDIWNQIAYDINLEARIREMWRELFTVSQFYAITWWGQKDYKIRGTSASGVKRKRIIPQLVVPLGITLLDPTKVVPVGNLMFNQDQLAYIADRTETDLLDAAVLNDPDADPVSRQIIVAKYQPPDYERRNLAKMGINADWLYILNPKNVWRHTLTRSQYERFAAVRLLSTFELLDLKHQLRQMDRAYLIGGPLRVDQRIPTPEGWKPIGSVQVGDKVYSVDGQTTDIIGVYPQGYLPMYKVTFSDGAEIYCDATHPWTVRAPKGKWRTITLQQILDEGLTQPNGKGATGKPQMRFRHEIPMAAPLDLPEADLLLDPYLLGYMLGDGNFDGTPSIACSEDDHPWEACLPDGIRVVPNRANLHEWCLSGIDGPGRPPKGLRGNSVKAALERLSLWGVHGRDKFIPEEYLWGSIEQRWALLQGLMDTDGTARPVAAQFANSSEKLVDGVIELVRSLGGVAQKRSYPDEQGRLFFHVDVYTPLHLGAPFRLARKVAAYRPAKKAVRRVVVAVERSLDAEAVCIKVNREDGLFLSEHEIACHNTNFIILIKKGTEHHPAKPEEIEQLRTQVTTVARVPILIGDHRLAVEIVTPKTDNTLSSDKYSTIDSRLTTRLYQMFLVHGGAGTPRSDDSVKLAKVIARGLESRRYMLKRQLERQIVGPCVDANESLQFYPTLRYHPTRVELDFDPSLVQFILDLRDRGDLSRDSVLNELDFDQDDEAIKRQREAVEFDDIFTPTNVPFAAPGKWGAVPVGPGGKPHELPGTAPNEAVAPAPSSQPAKQAPAVTRTQQKSAGRAQGGNKQGGGAAPGTGQGQPPRGRPSSK
jgi:hypothetical protein